MFVINKIKDIDNDQKASVLGLAMVFIMLLYDKKILNEVEAKALETTLFLLLSFYINRPNRARRKPKPKQLQDTESNK